MFCLILTTGRGSKFKPSHGHWNLWLLRNLEHDTVQVSYLARNWRISKCFWLTLNNKSSALGYAQEAYLNGIKQKRMIINSYVKIKVKEFVCLILPKRDQLLILLLHSTGKSIFPKASVKYISLMFLPFTSTVFSCTRRTFKYLLLFF